MNLSVIILTKNEEKNIKDCIGSGDFCDEIVIIDDDSRDKTVTIAKKLGAEVFQRDLNDDYAGQRNFGLEKARGRWCLFLDADERVPLKLKNEILEKIKNPSSGVTGYLIRRKDVFMGQVMNYAEAGNIKLLRLARKRAGKLKRIVHETWDIFGKTEKLKNPLYHYPHPTLREFISHLNKYTTLHAEANNIEHKKSSILKIIIYPPAKFVQNYIFRLGFLDGERGFMYAYLMSFHSFLSWSKLLLLQKRSYKL